MKENVKKEKFRFNAIITAFTYDGEVEEYYPTGHDEVKDCIESFKELIYSGDYKMFTYEWNSKDKDDQVRIRHKLTYTSYDGEPEKSERILDFGKNI